MFSYCVHDAATFSVCRWLLFRAPFAYINVFSHTQTRGTHAARPLLAPFSCVVYETAAYERRLIVDLVCVSIAEREREREGELSDWRLTERRREVSCFVHVYI